MNEGVIQLVIAQMEDVQAKHSALELAQEPDGQLRVRGPLGFTIDHDGHMITDTYQIELHIPNDYPDSPPSAYEPEGKVPEEFEHFMEAGNFCLGAPVEVRRQFAAHRNLLTFIDDQVIPYLFAYSYKREYGELPFGERDHGYFFGLLDFYMDHFGATKLASLKLLKCLADQFAPPLGPCPCGSGRKLKDCHGPKLDELRPHLSPERFEAELRHMIEEARILNRTLPEQDVMPKRMWKQKQKRLRRQGKINRRR